MTNRERSEFGFSLRSQSSFYGNDKQAEAEL